MLSKFISNIFSFIRFIVGLHIFVLGITLYEQGIIDGISLISMQIGMYCTMYYNLN